jgi:hypothetical protein
MCKGNPSVEVTGFIFWKWHKNIILLFCSPADPIAKRLAAI